MTGLGRQRDEAICRRIGDAREAAGLSQGELARGLTASTGAEVTARDVRRYESSWVPWQLLPTIAQQTGTTKAWLLSGDAALGPDDVSPWPTRPPAPATELARVRPGARRRLPGHAPLVALPAAFLVGLAATQLAGSIAAGVLAAVATIAIALARYAR